MKLNRRSFLKASLTTGIIAAGAGGTKPALHALAESEVKNNLEKSTGEWISTACQGCTTWCPVQVKVVNGRAIKVRGNPQAKANHGNVCPRSHIGLQEVYDPDRIKTPMRRTNPKKGRNEDPQFVAISWDEAIEEIAERMMELRKNNETHKFVLLRGRYTYLNEVLYGNFPKIFGSPNNISHSAICAEAEKFGSYFTEALWDYRDYDLQKARYLLLWGADPLASNRQVPHALNVWGEVMDRAKVAVVDPRLSITAAKADEWLPIVPGEDGALALAMTNVILIEGLWNKPFVGDFLDGINQFKVDQEVDPASFSENLTFGLVQWWNLEVKSRTPQWAAKITGIPADQIIRVAREFAAAAPHAISWLSPGASMQVRGAYNAMATHALNALVGSVDNEGGTLRAAKVPTNKLPDNAPFLDEVAKQGTKNKKIDQRGYKEFPALSSGKPGGGVVTNRVADAIIAEDPYEVKMAIGYWNNFVFSCTGASRWEEALTKLPFFVHITTNPAEMTMFADIVLPAAHHMFERLGYVKSKANKTAYLAMNQRVIEPLWDVRIDETEIPWMIAAKLAKKGFANLLDYFKAIKDPETGKSPTNGWEFTESVLKTMTQPVWDPSSEAKGDRFSGWEEFKKVGVWNSKPYPYQGKWSDFGTKTTKFEFYSETLKESLEKHAQNHNTNVDDILETCKYQARGELAFIPHYEEPFRWGTLEEFPFIFIDYRSRLNREARSANCLWYQELKDVDPGDERWEDVAKINPADGKKLGVKNGDQIRLISPVGQVECTVKLWEGIRPGTIAKCFGQGHWAYGRIAARDFKNRLPRGGNNNELLPSDFERLSGSTARHGGVTRVRVERV